MENISIRQETDEPISETFKITQNDKSYEVKIELIENNMSITLLEENFLLEAFENKFTLAQMVSKSEVFSNFNSFQDCFNYIKDALKTNNSFDLKIINDSKITLELRENPISFDLLRKEVDYKLKSKIINELYSKMLLYWKNLEKINENIIKENNEFKFYINKLKKEITKITEENKNIMNENNKLYKEIFNLNDNFKKEIENIKTNFKNKLNNEIRLISKRIDKKSDMKNIKIIEQDILDMQKELKNIINKNDKFNWDIKSIKKNIQYFTERNNSKNDANNDKKVRKKKENIEKNKNDKRYKCLNSKHENNDHYSLEKKINISKNIKNNIINYKDNTRPISRNNSISNTNNKNEIFKIKSFNNNEFQSLALRLNLKKRFSNLKNKNSSSNNIFNYLKNDNEDSDINNNPDTIKELKNSTLDNDSNNISDYKSKPNNIGNLNTRINFYCKNKKDKNYELDELDSYDNTFPLNFNENNLNGTPIGRISKLKHKLKNKEENKDITLNEKNK